MRSFNDIYTFNIYCNEWHKSLCLDNRKTATISYLLSNKNVKAKLMIISADRVRIRCGNLSIFVFKEFYIKKGYLV